MAQFVIPLEAGNPHFDMEVDLGGTLYTLEFTWNTRAEHWTLTLSLPQGETLVAGERLGADWGLLLRQNDPRLPLGSLLLVDTSGQHKDPGEDDLGDRVILVYDDGQ